LPSYTTQKQKNYNGLNASGRSPYSLTADEFKKQGLTAIPMNGALSVSVPGCVDGWFELSKKIRETFHAANPSTCD
jgi:gamma-glutamyltranspeptidase/glutathione hydrolase